MSLIARMAAEYLWKAQMVENLYGLELGPTNQVHTLLESIKLESQRCGAGFSRPDGSAMVAIGIVTGSRTT